MENYLEKFAKKNTPTFQQGGEVAAPAPAGQPDMEAMLMEFAQSQDPQLAVAICNLLLEAVAQQQGGAPAPAEAPAPSMRNGGRFASNTPVFTSAGKMI